MRPPDRPSRSQLGGGRPELLGYRMEEMGGGRVVVRWTPGPALSNPLGVVHGGYVGLLVDDTCGMAVVSLLDEFRAYPTASLHIDFLRPIPIGGSYRCDGTVLRAGRRLTFAETTVTDAEGRLLVRGSCTFALDLTDSPLAGFSAHPVARDPGAS